VPGPFPAGEYGVSIAIDGEALAEQPFATALVWRSDAGGDRILMSGTVELESTDAGYSAVFLDAGLAAVPASCGDQLVLQVTELDDAGSVTIAFPRLSVP
jgi:hypothetical protein